MKNKLLALTVCIFVYSCGREIASAIASSPSNVTTAPWRITRATISSSASDSDKDNLCNTEFGSDYEAGTSNEIGGWMNTTSSLVSASYTGVSYVGGNTLTNNAMGGIAPLFCVHK